MHSYEFGGREKKGIWTWYEREMSGQSCAYKGHLHTSKETLTI
jgi:hypothetical protein